MVGVDGEEAVVVVVVDCVDVGAVEDDELVVEVVVEVVVEDDSGFDADVDASDVIEVEPEEVEVDVGLEAAEDPVIESAVDSVPSGPVLTSNGASSPASATAAPSAA